MRILRPVVTIATITVVVVYASNAYAIFLPDNSSCNTTSTDGCFKITNQASGSLSQAITAVGNNGNDAVVATSSSGRGVLATSTSGTSVSASSSTGIGVLGQSTSASSTAAGVKGVSTAGPGMEAHSNTSNALVAFNNVTDKSAAVISAIPGGTNALAYWGGGGIQLTGSFAEKSGGGSWSAPSDVRIKKDIKAYSAGLSELLRVHPVTFKYNGLGGTEDNGKEFVGIIAQELEKVLPAMVSTRAGKLHKDDAKDTEIKRVDPSAFTYVLINAVQEQQKVIQRQEARIAMLEKNRAPLSSMVWPLAGLGLVPLALKLRRRREERK